MKHYTTYIIQVKPKELLIGLFLVLPVLKTNAQALEDYVSEAKANSPKIEALRQEYKIKKEKTNEVGGLPNTTISGGYFLSQPETRTGPQTAKFSIQQGIPWFGTLSAREDYQDSQAHMVHIMRKIAERQLTMDVSQSYYQLYALKAKESVTDSIISLLDTYEQLALKAVEVDKASAVDVLQLQIRQNELTEQKTVLSREFTAEKSRFNNLLNRQTPKKELMIPGALDLPMDKPNPALSMNEQTGVKSVADNPELMHFEHMKKFVDYSEKLNAKEAKPQLGFGVDYVAVSKRPDMNFNDNGKDIVMPMVSLSIPIFTQKHRSISRQNELEKEKLDAEKHDRENELQAALDESIQKQKSARITFETQQKNLEQTKNAEKILMKTYETSTLDFDDVLDIEKLRLKIQLKKIEAVKTYYQQQARIDYLTMPHQGKD